MGAWVALFALACQLVLSFGHFHRDFPPPAAAATQVAAALPGDASDTSPAPADHADGYCAICAVIHLAGSLVPSVEPALPVAFAFKILKRDVAIGTILTATRRPSFQSRAPPLA